jgi:hypothetical protein
VVIRTSEGRLRDSDFVGTAAGRQAPITSLAPSVAGNDVTCVRPIVIIDRAALFALPRSRKSACPADPASVVGDQPGDVAAFTSISLAEPE